MLSIFLMAGELLEDESAYSFGREWTREDRRRILKFSRKVFQSAEVAL